MLGQINRKMKDGMTDGLTSNPAIQSSFQLLCAPERWSKQFLAFRPAFGWARRPQDGQNTQQSALGN